MQNRRQPGTIWEPTHDLLLHKEQNCGPAASWLLGFFLSHPAVFQRPDTQLTGWASEKTAGDLQDTITEMLIKSVPSSVPHPRDRSPRGQRARSGNCPRSYSNTLLQSAPKPKYQGHRTTLVLAPPSFLQQSTPPCIQINIFKELFFISKWQNMKGTTWELELDSIKVDF